MTMKRCSFIVSLFCILSLLLLITACGSSAFKSTNNGGSGGGTTSNPSITTSSLPAGTVGAAYSATLQASGGTPPYSWSLKSGSLPAGVSLSAAGTISGTPSSAGTAGSLIFEVTDADKNSASSGDLSLKVNPEAGPVVTTKSLPAGAVGSTYAATLTASGGKTPYTWAVKSGSTLPAGLLLNSATGAITGTPTESGNFSSLVFEVTDSYQSIGASGALSLAVSPEVGPLVQTSSLQNGNVGVAYAATLTATGGTKPYSWSVKSGTLPGGLVLNSATGAITGTPTQSGTFGSLVFDVTDFYNSVGASGGLSVKIDAAVQVSTTSLPAGKQGSAYTGNLTATGGSGVYTWSLKSGNLPGGLSLNSTTGAITGTPTTANIFNGLVFEATDADTATGVSGALSIHVYNTANCSAGAESTLGTQPYAFLIKGFNPTNTNLVPVTLIGSFTPDGNGGITGGEEDVSGSGTQNITSGSYSLGADNNGCLALITSAGTTTFHFSVSTPNGSGAFTKGRIMLDDSSGTGTRGSGILRLQDSSAFAAGLNGMYAFLFSGTDATSGHYVMAGSFSAASPNFSNLALDSDDAGALLTNVTGGNGAFSSADGDGRGTASFAATTSGGNYNLNTVYYVVSSGEVLFASTDPLSTNPICGGEAFSTVGPFSATNLKSGYIGHGIGLAPTSDGPVPVIATARFDGVSTITGGLLTQDRAGAISDWSVAGTGYTVDATSGRIVFSGNFITPAGYLVTGFPGVSALLVGGDFPATAGMLEPQMTNPQPGVGIYSVGTDEDVDYLTTNQVGTLSLSSGNFSGTQNLSNAASPFLVENQAASSSYSFASDGTGTFWGNDAVSSGSIIYFISEAGANTHPAIISVTK